MKENLERDQEEFDLYRVLFPDEGLYRRAYACVKKILIGLFVAVAISVLAVIILFPYMVGLYRENGNVGYVIAALISGIALLVWIPRFVGLFGLRALLSRQERVLIGTFAHEKVLEMHGKFRGNLYKNSAVIFLCGIIAAVAAFVGAILAPTSLWSCVGALPLVLAFGFYYKLEQHDYESYKDKYKFSEAFFRFSAEEDLRRLQAYEEIEVVGKDSSLYSENGGGDYCVYLGYSYLFLEADSECKRVTGFGGYLPASSLKKRKISLPADAEVGILYLDGGKAERGAGQRISFDGEIAYDTEAHILLLGHCDDGAEYLKVFKNFYVQLSQTGELAGIKISDLILP